MNNAGQAASAPFLKTDAELWRRLMAVNLDGTFHCTQAALPGMLAAGWGRIVNIASMAGLKGYGYVSAYCASKHAVVGLTRVSGDGIREQGHHRQCGVSRIHGDRYGEERDREHQRPRPGGPRMKRWRS